MAKNEDNLTDQAVKLLEEFLKLSPTGCNELLSTRVDVDAALADHPTIQVALSKNKKATVGVLGLINSLLEVTGNARVAICSDNDKLIGFVKYSPPKATV